MTTTRPAPASGVSIGPMRVAAGRIRPMAPASSDTPMKRTSAGGTAPGQPMFWARTEIGSAAFMIPAIPKALASTICTTQSDTFHAFGRFALSDPGAVLGMCPP
jgi:hypothetical protein